MSNAFYDLLWREAVDELFDQIEIEIPADKSQLPKENEDKFVFFATLYIKYLKVYRELEEAQEQMVHAQKRQEVLALLDTVMGRIHEIKTFLMKVNHYPNVPLDDIIDNLHLTMDSLAVPPPRNVLDGKKEKLSRSQDDLLRALGEKIRQPIDEDVDPSDHVNIDFKAAILIIQTAERVRQARQLMLCKKAERSSDFGTGTSKYSRTEAAILIQKTYRGWITRKKVAAMRRREEILLGLIPEPDDENEFNAFSKASKIRKETQRRKEQELEMMKEEQYRQLLKKEGPKMAQEMKDKVRTHWELVRLQTGKYPEEYFKEEDGGSKKFFHPELFPEEPKKEDDDDKKKKGKKGKKGGKEKKKEKKAKGKKGKKDKKKDDDEEKKPEGPIKIPLSYSIHPMMKCLQHYTDVWQQIPESSNPSQQPLTSFIREEKLPLVEEELRKQIDILLKAELQNLKAREEADEKAAQIGKKSKKGKAKKGKGKKGKTKGGKGKKDKTEAPPPPLSPEELNELFQLFFTVGSLRECPHVQFSQIIGGWHLLGSNIRIAKETVPYPAMNEVKSLLTELVLFPFAMTPESLENLFPPKRFLLYGSRGVGKTMLVHSLVTASHATFLTLSSKVAERMQGMGCTVKELFKLAKELQPTIIYIDHAELFFFGSGGGKKGKKGAKKAKKKKGSSEGTTEITPEKLAQKEAAEIAGKLTDSLVLEMKSLAPTDKVAVIAETSVPWEANASAMADAFQIQIQVPRPDHTALIHIWEQAITEMHGVITPQLDLTLLADRTCYYSPSIIKRVCKDIISPSRLDRMPAEPLKTNEFSTALARNPVRYPTCEESELKIWTVFRPALPEMVPEYIEVEDTKKK